MSDEQRPTAPESVDDELARLRRLAIVETLVTTAAGTLDVREVFARVAEVARRVLHHDAITVWVFSDDREHAVPYAVADMTPGDLSPQPVPADARHLLTDSWEFEVHNDLQSDAGQCLPLVAHGFRSLLRVPVRLNGSVAALLSVASNDPHLYSRADVLVAQCIANHIALALSHQRLSDRARAAEALRARTATLELLDEMLAALIDTGELPEVFDRISAIARRVLPHDTVMLNVMLPDDRHARSYAISGVDNKPFPGVYAIPDAIARNRDWEHEITDDLPADPVWCNQESAKRGYRSALRVAIRVEGRLIAGLSFLSFAPGVYRQSDLLVARRIRDRLALHLTQGRGAEAAKRAADATERASLLESRVRALTDELNARSGYRRVVGSSLSWRHALTEATQVAATETTVLLLGESGTGKEVVARFIHRASARRDRPFVALNCAALPEQLLEAELFGYERGAFTGATQSKPGQLEQAAGGLLFLDEVAEMSVAGQAKFLRVLEEREFQRLGGTRVLHTDARIVAATNRDLLKAIECGHFRSDLYYRLNVFAIRLPPLRDRRDDVLPLTEAFVQEIGRSIGRPPAGISRDAREALLAYHWPGNVRELRNILERAAILCDGGLIAAEHLALGLSSTAASPAVPPPPTPPAASPSPVAPPTDLHSIERALIARALNDAHFNKSEAARALGLTRAQLYVRIRKHGLDKAASSTQ